MDTEDSGRAIKSGRAVVGSVSLTPTRSDKADALLVGPKTQVEKKLPDAAEILADAAELADDLEGGADYKRHLIGVFLRRAFQKAFSGSAH
jgi:carbon-monoxide dehydrogenase medium subunit